jgi:penicillin-binding protein 2
MDRENNDLLLSRRIFILGAGTIAATTLIVGRMFYLQVMEGNKYSLLAEKNRISWRFKPNPRGRIFDCTGKEIAGSENSFHLVVDHDARKHIRPILNALQTHLPLTPEQEARIIKDIKRNPAYIPTLIKEHLTWEEVTRIELHAASLEGIYITSGHRRHYPHGPAFSPITGYVSIPTVKDVAADPLLKLPGLRVGRQGIEQLHNRTLMGEPAAEQLEVNANLKVVRKLSSSLGKPGEDLQLTINHDLQMRCWDLLSQHKAGSCIVMDVHTGAIKALISSPSVDPTLFLDGIKTNDWKDLQNDPLTPLINRITSAVYPPGSTLKMIVALAGLEAGVIDENTHFQPCSGSFPLGSHVFHCWKDGGHGSLALKDALAASCDVYLYQLALKVGPQRIADMARRLGLGQATGIDFIQEKSGLVPDPSWKKRVKKTSWYPGDTLNLGIGQGFMLSSPLQLVRMTAALANGQQLVTPHLVTPPEGHLNLTPFSLNPRHLEIVRQGMHRAVHTPYGTCFSANQHTQGILMAGKSGSSQVKRIHMADRLAGLHRGSGRAWEGIDHAIFVGYAPFDNPRYATCVVVDHGSSGGRVAAPIGIQALREALNDHT